MHGPESQARQGCLEEDVSPPLITSSSSFWVPDGAPAVRQLKRGSEKRVFLDAARTDGGLDRAEGLQSQEWKNALISESSSPPSKQENEL